MDNRVAAETFGDSSQPKGGRLTPPPTGWTESLTALQILRSGKKRRREKKKNPAHFLPDN